MDTVVKSIYERIIELSDLSLQRKLWLNAGNNTGLISSYDELMCSLFDDFQFDDFVDKSFSEFGFSENTALELSELRKLLNSYKEKESDELIIDDPEWGKIVNQAKIVVNAWNRDLKLQ